MARKTTQAPSPSRARDPRTASAAQPARRRSGGRVTLADVARIAQVSTMTVSRALKDPSRVLPDARARIDAAIEQLGYIPNQAARTLASARSKLIGVLVPSLSNAVFVETLAGAQDCIGAAGYQLLIGNTGYAPAQQAELLGAYLSHAPAGFLVAGIDGSRAVRTRLAAAGVPLVHMFDLAAQNEWSVGFSQRSAGFAVGAHLLERGYRRPGFIAAQLDPRTMQRRAGFRRALSAAGLRDDVEVLTKEPSSVALGSRLLAELLANTPDCDAVFCCNDDLALGALFECQRAGIAVPRELAIAGFNDLPFAACSTPSITTVATPRYQVGFDAASLLLRILDGDAPDTRRVDLGFELVAREST
ncbi:HTH-type transcriptional regulator GntR [Paraburkholderia caballeronis]|uniref:Transcriptional regulator, LacI family n=1 Tax=Paraburkholderia caballeronis TaxID=416943 RepID=A0A1H7LG56_9BURK|nr:LacI family DNA-binding transcriptional regulator [Paraburkholderia caballeronis]PXW28428.1 LacI family transcriptional regulator [Paraburkholderia caballeronis]PXX03794.1 LacI family transcriptional regulator [Paraburkholderia caballeronis]RAK04538.1 LacI family transcriptional regulator [Paraburkholderia caballeronis]SED75972.1 transcriptional regulator, LacI family [Paraburkholderia caballeronis]SEK97357.1 transcriptional regulator, LacI family [Paraburkholderia caballeronis]